MLRLATIFLLIMSFPCFGIAQDSLLYFNGEKIISVAEWEKKRPLIKKQFLHLVYGEMPAVPTMKFSIIRQVEIPLKNIIYKEVAIDLFKEDVFTRQIRLALFLPKSELKVPVVLALNKCGNQTVSNIKQVTAYNDRLLHNYCAKQINKQDGDTPESIRGLKKDFWALDSLFNRGYGFATFHESDIGADIDTLNQGIFPFYPELDNEHGWKLISAWSWGLQRAIDYLHTDELIDTNKIIAFGHSRRGKTALLTAALDERVDMVVPHQSGTVGMALSKGRPMERPRRINKTFPNWFSDSFKELAKKPKKRLSFDQHYLVALVAPRPLLETVGTRDYWSSYWVSKKTINKASPVYELYGKKGVVGKGKLKKKKDFNSQKESNLLQVRRPFGHTMNGDYWSYILDFIELKLP